MVLQMLSIKHPHATIFSTYDEYQCIAPMFVFVFVFNLVDLTYNILDSGEQNSDLIFSHVCTLTESVYEMAAA